MCKKTKRGKKVKAKVKKNRMGDRGVKKEVVGRSGRKLRRSEERIAW